MRCRTGASGGGTRSGKLVATVHVVLIIVFVVTAVIVTVKNSFLVT